MSEVLISIRNCCDHLDSDKVTERKKYIESLRRELNRPLVQRQLDRNTDEGRGFTWDSAFKAVSAYMLKEAEYLKKNKGASSTSINTRDRKKQEVGAVLKWFVRIANQRGKRLGCAGVVEHVLALMKDEFTATAFGVDCCSVLQKDLLRSRTYYCELTPSTWHDLLIQFCKALHSPIPGLSQDHLSRIVKSVLAGAVVQSNIRRSSMFSFFTRMVGKLRSERSATVIENIVVALNTFSLTVASDCRKQLCKLGEDSMSNLLHVWKNNSATTVKDEVVVFLRLQLRLHHPQGVLQEGEGAYAADLTIWKSHLQQLYELIFDEWRHAGSRMKLKATGSREVIFKAALVDLAADVCHQVFSASYAAVDVNQVISDSSQSPGSSRSFPQGGGGAKRRKVEPGWSVLQDMVATQGRSANVTPWLQLLRTLLHKYPNSLPEDQLQPLVSTLQQVQAETKRAEIQTWILQTLQALALCQCKHRNLNSGLRMALHTEWTKVWSCAIRTISLHTTESHGFDLLTCLLHCGIVNPDREHWRLFIADSTPPTSHSVQFLATYLRHHSLPENHVCQGSSIIGSTSAVTKGNHPLRHQLLSWLLPAEDQDEPGERLHLVKLLKCLPTTLAAYVLGALTQRTTHNVPHVTPYTRSPAATVDNMEQTLQDVEMLHLRSSFDFSVEEPLKCKSIVERPAVGSSSVVSSVKQSLMQGLERVGVQVLDFNSSEATCGEALIHYANLLCKTLAVLLELGVLSEEEVARSKLGDSLKTLLKRVTAALGNLWRKSDAAADGKAKLQSLSSLVLALEGMLTWDHSLAGQVAQGSVSWLAEMCRSITPRDLLNALFEIVKKKGKSSTSTKGSSSKMPSKDPFHDDFMDTKCDDEFEGNGKDDFDENSNLSEESATHKGCQSLLSFDALSESEHLALWAAQLLCSWAFTGTSPEGQRSSKGHSTLSTADVQGKLLEVLEQEEFDAFAAFDVQLFFTIAEAFITSSEKQDEILSRLLYVLRTVASANRKDLELCASVLSLLSRLIPFLQSDTPVVSTDLKESRDVTLCLLAAFWKLRLRQEGVYTAPVCLAIAKCMHALIVIDPTGEWTILKSKKSRERGQGDNDPTVSGEFCSLLTDSSHTVRIFMASAIQCLFCSDGKPFTKEVQNQSFDTVYQMVQHAMELQGRLSTDERTDESANRTASLLTSLSTVARCSPACEKKTVFALMQAIQLNGIEISLMKKVLQSISVSLHYSSVTVFLESHLSYLIHQWLAEKYVLPQFPHQLLACSTEVDFYRKYHRVVIPHLVSMQSLDAIHDIAGALDTDWIELLKGTFPQSIAHILPLFGHTRLAEEDTESEEYRERRIRAVSCFNALENTLGKETIDNMIQVHLDSIVVELLAMLYEPHTDDSDMARFTSATDPEPNPPFFTTYTVKATLDYLTNCHAGSRALTLVSLLAKTQDGIQKILLALHIRISKSHRAHEKHRMVLAYRLFVSLLLAELSSGLGGSWAMVLQDIIYTLVHTIREGTETGEREGFCLAWPCIDLLRAVCVTGLENCHEELGKHLHVIMGTLVPLVEKQDRVADEALSLINLLVIDNSASLSSALKYLDPLPDSPRLARAKAAQRSSKYVGGEFTLMEEVNHFLMVGRQGGTLRVEGLKHLHHQLATRKEELSVMVQQCAEGSDRTIIQLITELVDLSGTKDGHLDSRDDMAQAVKEEAARCLGDIGAPNLSTVALQCEETERNASFATALRAFAKAPDMSRYVVIVHLLKDYLTDPNVDTVEAAADCLKTILATTSGQRCSDKYKEKNIDKLFCYLHPFRPSKKKATSKQAPRCSRASFTQTIGDPSLWQPAGGNHGDWVRSLTVALIQSGGLQDEILQLLEPICKVKVEFAEKILPYLIHDILSTGNDLYRQILSERIQAVFAGHCDSTSSSRATTPIPCADVSSSQLSQRSLQILLDVMHYLRTQERPTQSRTKSTAWDNNFWLDVNYLLAAKAAQNCRAHFTCLLFTEIWCDVQRSRQGSSAGDGSGVQTLIQPSGIDTLSSLSSQSDINVQSLLLEAYSSIGEPDGVYGCGAGRLTDTYARIHTYEHEGNWSKALSAYDLKLHSKSFQTGKQEVGVLQAMQNLGLSHILTVYLQGLRSEEVAFGPEMAQFQYEAAWRNALWDMELDNRNQTNSSGYHQSLFTALSCLRDGESESFTGALQQARLDTLHQLSHVSIESAYSVYPMLSRLQGLVELEDFGSMMLSKQQPNSVLRSWNAQLALMDNDFEFAEPTLVLRTVLLQLLLEQCNTNNHAQAYEGLVAHLKIQTEIARKAESFQIAEKALATLQALDRPAELQTNHSWWRLIEEAKVYWTRNEKTTAMHLMRALLDKISRVSTEDPIGESLHPEVLTIYGNWQAETNSDSPNVIIEQYFERAVEMYDLRDDTSLPAIESQLSLARFADSQYQNIVNYMKSSEYEDKQALMKQAKKEYEELHAMGDRISRYARTLEKQSEIDERELDSMMQDRENFLQKAVECYLKCLEFGTSDHDIRVFRVCSLWFENSSEDDINKLVQDSFERIESRKLLPLLYQLAARMTTRTQDKQLFYDVLNELIEKTARDHPYHALPIILALANANKDAVITSRRTGRLARANSMRDDASHADESRMQAARRMLIRLRSTHCNQIIADLEKLSDAYIELAYWDVSDRKKETGPIKLAPNQPLTQLRHLEHVAMPTMEIPVDASCRYENIVSIDHFEGTFKLAGGVNLPKIITCVGSDGIKRRQLVKGKDDLRQDAVMQQVFALVNRLLQRNQETRKRRLRIRRYKIVPLSQRSGLLEWCEGTMPLGEYLIGNQRTDFGAHRRYRPQDSSSMECRKKMAMAHSSSEQGKKYREYLEVMKKFQPVFRHFFLEKFPDPAVWLERRLAYTRSVATSSIVGYVVGLGDRHVQNILIDCNQAELVHIDLGVAFEQGRILPTPETVPFRLTRDVVDGMGVAGVEGVFRRCCEKTMVVMHNSQEALLTILQVLLYDPLYVWTMSPQKAMALQQRRDRNDPDASELNATTSADLTDGEAGFKGQDSSEGTEVNKVAERVVLRLRQKLQGVEEGVAMSVKGQVNRLIQEARDPKNLCRLFPGWQPWI